MPTGALNAGPRGMNKSQFSTKLYNQCNFSAATTMLSKIVTTVNMAHHYKLVCSLSRAHPYLMLMSQKWYKTDTATMEY